MKNLKAIHIILLITLGFCCVFPCKGEAKNTGPRALPINRPEQITSETDPVLNMAVSGDGRLLVYTTVRNGNTDLWMRSADPSVVVLPKQLTDDPSVESFPAFSPDNRYIVYVGTGHDVKGDIYIIDLKADKPAPKRLTGRETEDGGPCFSADGNTLYFHQSKPGDTFRNIVSIE